MVAYWYMTISCFIIIYLRLCLCCSQRKLHVNIFLHLGWSAWLVATLAFQSCTDLHLAGSEWHLWWKKWLIGHIRSQPQPTNYQVPWQAHWCPKSQLGWVNHCMLYGIRNPRNGQFSHCISSYVKYVCKPKWSWVSIPTRRHASA